MSGREHRGRKSKSFRYLLRLHCVIFGSAISACAAAKIN
jgi:hypothetical protein